MKIGGRAFKPFHPLFPAKPAAEETPKNTTFTVFAVPLPEVTFTMNRATYPYELLFNPLPCRGH